MSKRTNRTRCGFSVRYNGEILQIRPYGGAKGHVLLDPETAAQLLYVLSCYLTDREPEELQR